MAFGLDDAMLAMAGTQLVGGLLGSDAAKTASGQQSSAANRATDITSGMFNTIQNQQAPYRQAGSSAISSLGFGLGLPGYTDKNYTGAVSYNDPVYGKQTFQNADYFKNALYQDSLKAAGGDASKVDQGAIDKIISGTTPINDPNFGQLTHQFDANDLKSNLAPNYDFMLQQGTGATANLLNSKGGVAGNTLKGVTDYATNYAGNAYQNAFNNYTTNQSNIFNRLSAIAGLGSSAGSAGTTGAPQFASSIAGTTQAAGAAQAAGTVGSTNALTGGLSNAASWYSLPSILNMGGGGGGTGNNFLSDAAMSMAASG